MIRAVYGLPGKYVYDIWVLYGQKEETNTHTLPITRQLWVTVIGLTALLFNKTVNVSNSIIEKKRLFLLQLNILNYIT